VRASSKRTPRFEPAPHVASLTEFAEELARFDGVLNISLSRARN
jgi:hypothetical protein